VEFGVMTSFLEDRVNGDKLRQLREERGWDVWHLARLTSLSVAQIQALECGGVDCFYTKQIKNNAARKLAKVFDVPESTVFMQGEVPVAPLPEAFEQRGFPEKALVNSNSLYAKTHRSTWMGYIVMTFLLLSALVLWALQPKAIVNLPRNVGELTAPTASEALVTPVAAEKALDPIENAGPVNKASLVALAPAEAVTSATSPALPKPSGQEWTPASQQEQAQAENACPFEENVSTLEAAKPTKSAEKVSLMLYKAGMLCVQDATGKVWQEDLKPWLGRTYFGKAPWKIHSPVLPQADVYFQGEKIRLAEITSRTIALNSKEISR